MKIKLLFLSATSFFTLFVSAQNRLLAIDSNRSFYEIEMTTGAKTLIGTLSSTVGTTAGLAYDMTDGIMYLSSSGNDELYTLNPTIIANTLIGGYGDTSVVMHGLEYVGLSEKLYGMSSSNGGLYEINKTTGVATLIGLTGLSSFCNLGWDSTNNVMYLTNSGTDSLYTINLTTAVVTLVGALNGPTNPNGLAFDHVLNQMFLVDNSTDTLYTLNLSTGAANAIGSTGTGNLLGLVFVEGTLNSESFSDIEANIFYQNNQVTIHSTNTILSVDLYDITGKKLFNSVGVNSNNFLINTESFGSQILIVNVETENGVYSKKIINK